MQGQALTYCLCCGLHGENHLVAANMPVISLGAKVVSIACVYSISMDVALPRTSKQLSSSGKYKAVALIVPCGVD